MSEHNSILQRLNNDPELNSVIEGIVDKIMERGKAVSLVGGDPTIRIYYSEIDPYEDGETAIWGVVELELEMGEPTPDSIDDDDAEGLCDLVCAKISDSMDDLSEEISSQLEEVSYVLSFEGTYYG